MTEGHRNQSERAPTSQKELFEQQNIVLDYNPNSEITICEHILILSD